MDLKLFEFQLNVYKGNGSFFKKERREHILF